MDFYLWSFMKDQVYQPPLLRNVDEMKARISAAVTQVTTVTQVTAVTQVTPDTPQKVREETEFSWDVCQITFGAHMKNLYPIKNLKCSSLFDVLCSFIFINT
jgi:hypothetical protein